MYAACPSCKSLYRLEPVHLRAANGRVRCGKCQAVFNAASAAFEEAQQALDYVEQQQLGIAQEIDELIGRALGDAAGPEADAASARVELPPPETRDVVTGLAPPETREVVSPVAPAATQDVSAGVAPRVVADTGKGAISDTQRRGWRHADVDFFAWPAHGAFPRAASGPAAASGDAPAFLFDDHLHQEHRTNRGAIAAALALIALLLGQYVWTERNRLAAIDALRPFMETFCRPLACDLPLRRDVNKVEMVEYEVRDHPRVDDALLINATLVNRADFVQPYPGFQVSFSDLSGTAVSMRRFLPADYVADQTRRDKGLAPSQRAYILLEVVDPGDRAVSFQFHFF